MTFKNLLWRFSRLEPAGLIIGVFVMAAYVVAFLSDPDYFWHLRAGQWIVEHGELPAHDIFSYTRPDAPWVLHEWLFEVLLYLVHQAAGTPGVRGLVAACLGLTFAVTYRGIRRHLDPGPALWVGVASFAVILSFPAPRPQLFSFLFYAVYLHQVLDYLRTGDARRLYWLPAIMLVWVNSHAGYVMGLVLLAIVSASVWFARALGSAASGTRDVRLRPLLVCLAVTAATSLLNPYHVHHWLYPIQTAGLDATNVIAEWHAPQLKDHTFLLFLGMVFAYGWSLAFRTSRPSVTELLLTAAMTLLTLKALRHLPFGVLTLAPLLAYALSDGALARLQAGWTGSSIRGVYARTLGRGRELGSSIHALNWCVLGAALLVAFAYGPTFAARQKENCNSIIGWKAVDFVVEHGISGRMFNEYGFGGLLIQRLYPSQQVFIDGRADMYGDPFVKEYLKITTGEEGWSAAFDRYAIDYVICPRNRPIRQLLLQRGDFASVYADKDNAVLVRRLPRFESLIRETAEP